MVKRSATSRHLITVASLVRFLRTPLAVAVVATLALAIGANTAVFGIVDAALLRPPPFSGADRLAVLYITHATARRGVQRERWSYDRYELLRVAAVPRLFESVASFSRSLLTLTAADEPVPVEGEVVDASYFRILRVRPLLGRTFLDDEAGRAAAGRVAIIGEDLWLRRFHGDSGAVGRTIDIAGIPVVIVGILPADFRGLTGRAELWIPPPLAATVSYDGYLTTNQNFISIVGRLSPGTTLARAQAELAAIGTAIHRAQPSHSETPADRFAATALSLNDARVDRVDRQSVLLLLAAVGFLFLLACANVANLLLARASARQKETAIRIALGATRADLVRVALRESAILALAGGAVGALLAAWSLPFIQLPSRIIGPRNMYGSLGDFADPRIDARVLAFVLCITMLAAFLCGALPALRGTRADLTQDLKSGAPGSATGADALWARRRPSLRGLIVALETALAVVLLVAGALMLESFRRLRNEPLGFDPTRLLTFWLRPAEVRYPPPRAALLIERVLAEVQRVPGVVAATVDGCTPVSTGCANSTLFVIGHPQPRREDAPGVLRHYVAPDHFRVLGVPLVRGRLFTNEDRTGRKRVAIINELAARRFFPGEDPIGKRVWFGGGSSFDRPDSAAEIVGIVGDVAYQSLDERPMQPDFYTPYLQFTYASRAVTVRITSDPGSVLPAIRRAVRAVDPNLPLYEVRTMEEHLGDSRAARRYQALLLGGFAAAGLLLAAMGIYAVVAHSVARRTREVGIRIALGALGTDVVSLVVGEGMRLPVAGLAVGLAASLALTRALRAMVYGVSATSPAIFGAVTIALGSVAVAACYVPARRAARVDPMIAMKAE